MWGETQFSIVASHWKTPKNLDVIRVRGNEAVDITVFDAQSSKQSQMWPSNLFGLLAVVLCALAVLTPFEEKMLISHLATPIAIVMVVGKKTSWKQRIFMILSNNKILKSRCKKNG